MRAGNGTGPPRRSTVAGEGGGDGGGRGWRARVAGATVRRETQDRKRAISAAIAMAIAVEGPRPAIQPNGGAARVRRIISPSGTRATSDAAEAEHAAWRASAAAFGRLDAGSVADDADRDRHADDRVDGGDGPRGSRLRGVEWRAHVVPV
jgi:hypothetical protein